MVAIARQRVVNDVLANPSAVRAGSLGAREGTRDLDAGTCAGAIIQPAAMLRRPGTRVTVLAPHPDDESLAAGGLIQRALALGVPVDVVFASDGENNPWPQRWIDRRIRIGPRERVGWAARRRAEADAALHALGAGQVGVHRLGWPDGALTWRLLDDTATRVASIRGLLEQLRPTVLVLPDLADRHPDHSAIHVLVDFALRESSGLARPDWLGYVLHGRRSADKPRCAVFDLGDAELTRKRRAIEAHASQMALSRRRLLRSASASEQFVAGLGGDDHAGPTLPWCPPRSLRSALALLVVDAKGGERVRLGTNDDANLFWSDGMPAARTARVPEPPYYVKLYCPLPSPWVFDCWGWSRVALPHP